MRSLKILLIGIVGIICLLFIGSKQMEKSQGFSGTNTLTIYNWGDYIDPDLIKKFEAETGYKVSYETFDSNEAMFTKVQQGGTAYDLTIPSEYMIQKMIQADMLYKLDYTKITGIENIDERFMDLDFDPDNRYSIPYFWGTLGIIYNEKLVTEGPVEHWDDLWRDDLVNNVMLFDGAREVVGLALNSQGHSLNSIDQEELAEAAEKLTSLPTNVKAIVADEIKMYMINEEASAAVTFSGEAAEMLDNNDSLHYVIPSEGSNLWFDNVVIPKTAKNIEGAYAFINFLLKPENAAQNAEYIGYSTPNKTAMGLLPEELTSDEQFYPSDEVVANLEVYENLAPIYIEQYNDIFLDFKMQRK